MWINFFPTQMRWNRGGLNMERHCTIISLPLILPVLTHQPLDLTTVESRPILRSEIVAAVKKLKAGKAPGTDEIPGEFLKHGGDCIIDQLHHICNDIWMKETIPDDWTKSILLTMHKKGDITKCENYRTISLINHSSKIHLEIIRSWMKLHVEAMSAEEQAAFRPGRSTVEQVFTLKMLIQHRIEKKDGKVFAVFIDYKKAFDRVWHDGLFSVLQQFGVPRKLINIIRDLYSKAKSCIRVNNNLTDWFKRTIGVRQGCLLSPDLFNVFLENILAEAFEDCKKLLALMLMAINWKTSVLPMTSLSLQTLRMIYKPWSNEYMMSARNTGWRSAYQKPKL